MSLLSSGGIGIGGGLDAVQQSGIAQINANASLINGAAKGSAKTAEEELLPLAKTFESFLWSYTMKSMRNSVDKGELFHGGMAEEMFEDMRYQKMAEDMMEHQSFGLADMIVKDLTHSQNAAAQSRKNNTVNKEALKAYEAQGALAGARSGDIGFK